MSRAKRGSSANEMYANFGMKINTANDREARIERMYVRMLTELCMNRFKWEGLPDSVNVRFLEMTLFSKGLSIFFDSTEFGYLALQGAPGGIVNYENEPTTFQPIGGQQQWPLLTDEQCVPIWSNYSRVPDLDIILIYATKFANLDRTVEINSKNMRQTKVITSTEDTRLTMRNISRQQDEGQQQIEVNGAMGDLASNIAVLDLGVEPLTIEKVQLANNREWNRCMTLLGIDNANMDKKERLVSDEVDANNGQVESMRYVNLNARRIAADKINKKYNLNVTVDYYTADDQLRKLDSYDNPDLTSGDEGEDI